MKVGNIRLAAFTASMTFVVGTLQSQDAMHSVAHCDRVLIPDIVTMQSDERIMVATMDILSEETWNQMSTDKKAGFGAILKGVPVGGDFDFKTFSEARSKYFREVNFSSNREMSSRYLSSVIPASAREIWLACVTQGRSGLSSYCPDDSGKILQVTFVARRPPGSSDDNKIRIQGSAITGGKAIDSNVPENKAVPEDFHLVDGVPRTFLYERKEGEDLNIVVNTQLGPLTFRRLAIVQNPQPPTRDVSIALLTTSLNPELPPYTPFQPNMHSPNPCEFKGTAKTFILKPSPGRFDIYVSFDVSAREVFPAGEPTGMVNTWTGEPTLEKNRIKVASIIDPRVTNVEFPSDLQDSIKRHIGRWEPVEHSFAAGSASATANGLVKEWRFHMFSRAVILSLNDSLKVRLHYK